MSDDFDTDETPVPSFARRVLSYGKDWLIAILITLFGFWALSQWRAPDLPEYAPDFSLETIDGQSVQLSSLQGKTVVLNFWTTWCGVCKSETPDIDAFAAENPEIPVLGIAIESKDKKALVKATAKKWGMNYPVMLADKNVMSSYKINTFPTTVIVAPDGKIANAHVGKMLPKQLNLAVGVGSSGCNTVAGGLLD